MNDPSNTVSLEAMATKLLQNLGVDIPATKALTLNNTTTLTELVQLSEQASTYNRLVMQPGRTLGSVPPPPPLPPFSQTPTHITFSAEDFVNAMSKRDSQSEKVTYAKRVKELTQDTAFGVKVTRNSSNKLEAGQQSISFYECLESAVEVIRAVQANEEHQVTVTDLLFVETYHGTIFTEQVKTCLKAVFKQLVGPSILGSADADELETLQSIRLHSRMDNWAVRLDMYMQLKKKTKSAGNSSAAWAKVRRFRVALNMTMDDAELAEALNNAPQAIRILVEDRAREGAPQSMQTLDITTAAYGSRRNQSSNNRTVSALGPDLSTNDTRSTQQHGNSDSTNDAVDLGACSVGICRYAHGADVCPMDSSICRSCWKPFSNAHPCFGRCPNNPTEPSPAILSANGKIYKKLSLPLQGKGGKGQKKQNNKYNRIKRKTKQQRSRIYVKQVVKNRPSPPSKARVCVISPMLHNNAKLSHKTAPSQDNTPLAKAPSATDPITEIHPVTTSVPSTKRTLSDSTALSQENTLLANRPSVNNPVTKIQPDMATSPTNTTHMDTTPSPTDTPHKVVEQAIEIELIEIESESETDIDEAQSTNTTRYTETKRGGGILGNVTTSVDGIDGMESEEDSDQPQRTITTSVAETKRGGGTLGNVTSLEDGTRNQHTPNQEDWSGYEAGQRCEQEERQRYPSLDTLSGSDCSHIQSDTALKNMWDQQEDNSELQLDNTIRRGVVKFYTSSRGKGTTEQADLKWGVIQPLNEEGEPSGDDVHFNLFALGNIPEHTIKGGMVVDYTMIPGTNSAEEINMVTFNEGVGSALADSGAYIHATPNKSGLINYRPLQQPIPIGTAHSGTFILLRGIGDLEIVSGGNTKIIRNVFYAPECGSTLLSVRLLTKVGGWILYSDSEVSKLTHKSSGEVIILDESFRFSYSYERKTDSTPQARTMTRDELASIPGMKFTGGKERVEVINALNGFDTDLDILHKEPLVTWYKDGLFQFQPLELRDETSMCKWHRRLGHLSQNYVKKFAKMHGIGLTGSLGAHVCETCALSKMIQASSKQQRARADKFLDRVHADTIGPFKPTGLDKSRYALILVDCHSRAPYVYPQKTNTAAETHESFQKFCTQVQGKPKELQVDGGSEFRGVCETWCATEGIRIRKSPPYAHYLNGTVERKIRSLKEMTRCMLTYSRLPHSFWPYALQTAQHIQYRSPSRALPEWKSPVEMITGETATHKHFKIFGSKVVFHKGDKTDGTTSALAARGREGVCIGYGEGYPTGTYTILDTETFEVVHSNQVVFFEAQNISNTKAWEHIDHDDSPLEGFDHIDDDDDYEPESEDEDSAVAPPTNAATRPTRAKRPVQRYNPEYEASRPQLKSRTMHAFLPRLESWQMAEDYETVGATIAALGNSDIDRKWQEAKQKELSQFSRFNAFTEVDRRTLPKGTKVIRTHFVRTIKADGRYKYRLVAAGNEQLGSSAFSPTAAMTSLRMVSAYCTFRGWITRQSDVSAAYLQSPIHELVYVERPPPPPGVDKRIYRQTVWLLNKAMYGLRKSPLYWYNTVSEAMIEHGLTPTSCDSCVFQKEGLIVGIWVDDFLYGGTPEAVAAFEKFLTKKFKCDVPSDASRFCGIDINQTDDQGTRQLSLSQETYVSKLLEEHNVSPAVVETPIRTYLEPCDPSEADDTLPFREILGGLMYVMLATRPDIAFAVHHLSRFGQCFGPKHLTAVTRLLQYVHHTRHKCITYRQQRRPILEAYSDANWAGCPFTKKSTSGRIVFYGGSPVSWCSQLQRAISTSSCESELYAVTDTVKEVTYLRILLECMSQKSLPTSTIHCDNHATVRLCAGQDNNLKRLRHLRTLQRFLDIRRKFIQSQVHEVQVVHCQADSMLADMLTKPLGPKKLSRNRDLVLNAWQDTDTEHQGMHRE